MAAYLDCHFCRMKEKTTTRTYSFCDSEGREYMRKLILVIDFIEKTCFKAEDTLEILHYWRNVIRWYSTSQG